MTNVVRRVDFQLKHIQTEQSGGHVADLENGYLRLANQIQDAVCKVELSGREFRVLNAIIRLTYGWSKKEDRITNSLIADKTNLTVKHVSEAVLSIANRRIISLRRIGQTRYIGINTNLDQWAYTKPNCPKCILAFQPAGEIEAVIITLTIPENGDSKKSIQTIPENRDNHPQNQGEVSPKIGNTKDILPKTDKHKDINPPKSPKGDDSVKTVFEFWKEAHNHPTSKLDDKRRKRINARLSEGYPVDDLLLAISGALNDPWLMGKNPGNKRYDGIETILRDAAQVERLRDLSGNEHAKAIADGKYSAVTARNIQNLQNWVGSSEDAGAPF